MYICCYHGKQQYVFIVVGTDVVVSNIKLFIVAMEMQQWVCFAVLSSKKKKIHTAVNNNKY
jgi:hypothetical protein